VQNIKSCKHIQNKAQSMVSQIKRRKKGVKNISCVKNRTKLRVKKCADTLTHECDVGTMRDNLFYRHEDK
jgi:hypothetical protein